MPHREIHDRIGFLNKTGPHLTLTPYLFFLKTIIYL